jgi:dTDP-4-amino-4,6-dideoxygalactose transaminase
LDRRPLIPFLKPQLPTVDAVAAYFSRSQEVHWFSNGGPCHALLVQRLEAMLGRQLRCVPLANATLGLMLGMRAMVERVDPRRREVLLPSFTFAATVNAVLWAGFKPVFVDVESESWHLCPEALSVALRSGTAAAVLACSTFGTPPPQHVRDAWREAAQKEGLPLLVDSAAGFGARDEGAELLGDSGDAEVFSFHATKPFAIGEGGLFVTSDETFAVRVERLANFGFEDGVVHRTAGFNAKLAEWPAATALAVLDGFEGIVNARRAAADDLLEALEPHGFLRQRCDGTPAWQFVPVLAPSSADRDRAHARATAAGVELRTYFSVPLHRMPAFEDIRHAGPLETTDELAARILSLPMANDQTPAQRELIVDTLVTAVA